MCVPHRCAQQVAAAGAGPGSLLPAGGQPRAKGMALAMAAGGRAQVSKYS